MAAAIWPARAQISEPSCSTSLRVEPCVSSLISAAVSVSSAVSVSAAFIVAPPARVRQCFECTFDNRCQYRHTSVDEDGKRPRGDV